MSIPSYPWLSWFNKGGKKVSHCLSLLSSEDQLKQILPKVKAGHICKSNDETSSYKHVIILVKDRISTYSIAFVTCQPMCLKELEYIIQKPKIFT